MRTLSASRTDTFDVCVTSLVERARAGDQQAWSHLVTRFDPILRRAARSFRLAHADVDDVVQTTWMLLFTHIDSIREPAAVPGWLATTARRQALRLLRSRAHELPTENLDLGPSLVDTPESLVLAAERSEVVGHAIATLPAHQRRVIATLAAQPTLRYEQLGELLEMPTGSIGPTRARGLVRLRGDRGLRALMAA